MLGDAGRHPIVYLPDRRGVLAALGAAAHDLLEGGTRNDEVPARFIEALVGLVAQHQAIMLVVDGEALGDAAYRFAQELRRFFRLSARGLQFGRTFGDQSLGAHRPTAHDQDKSREQEANQQAAEEHGPGIPGKVAEAVGFACDHAQFPAAVAELQHVGEAVQRRAVQPAAFMQHARVVAGVEIHQAIGNVAPGRRRQRGFEQAAEMDGRQRVAAQAVVTGRRFDTENRHCDIHAVGIALFPNRPDAIRDGHPAELPRMVQHAAPDRFGGIVIAHDGRVPGLRYQELEREILIAHGCGIAGAAGRPVNDGIGRVSCGPHAPFVGAEFPGSHPWQPAQGLYGRMTLVNGTGEGLKFAIADLLVGTNQVGHRIRGFLDIVEGRLHHAANLQRCVALELGLAVSIFEAADHGKAAGQHHHGEQQGQRHAQAAPTPGLARTCEQGENHRRAQHHAHGVAAPPAHPFHQRTFGRPQAEQRQRADADTGTDQRSDDAAEQEEAQDRCRRIERHSAARCAVGESPPQQGLQGHAGSNQGTAGESHGRRLRAQEMPGIDQEGAEPDSRP